ncbi:LmeA family phospholipid-binding protein [Micromonospora haikouensis]|uniref:LmeA family phospholipid-binding protein n=1 Tax=Micromonospora haikouensis TaxID=686309 RepID=UPI0033C3B001
MRLRIIRRRRAALLAAACVAVLATVAVVADRWVARTAAQRLSDRLACAAGLDRSPTVDLGGFPVLPGVLTGELGRVSVRVADVTRGDVRAAEVDAELSQVRLPGEQPARVGALDLRIRVGFDALPGTVGERPVHYRGVGGLLAVETTAPMAGQQLPVTVLARPAIDAGRLTVTPTEIEVLGMRRPAGAKLVERLTGGRDLSRPLPALPAGLSWQGVDVADDGLRLRLTGHDLTLPGGGDGRRAGTCGGN